MGDLEAVCERLGDRAGTIILDAPLRYLDDFWLEFRCQCGRTVITPVKVLAVSHGRERRLGKVVGRATTKCCAVRPAHGFLNETANRLANFGAAPGWSVRLPMDLDSVVQAVDDESPERC